MSYSAKLTKENLDYYLRELAKEFRRLNGKTTPAEMILIGGASVLINYGFRDMTSDVDAIISASSVMKEAINKVGDRFALESGWLNTDFQNTKSFSPRLIEVSVYYKVLSNVLTIRTVAGEYLIAMKLMSGRVFKNDLSDVIGILHEHEQRGTPISYEQIDAAVCRLYDAWKAIPDSAIRFIRDVYAATDYGAMYERFRSEERESRETLLDFNVEYPGVLNEDNMSEILKQAQLRMKKKGDE
jgi:hypothetical protein